MKLPRPSAVSLALLLTCCLLGVNPGPSALGADGPKGAAKAEGSKAKKLAAKDRACKVDKKVKHHKSDKGRTRNKVQRFGSVIELRPEKKDLYIQLHENTWKDVLAQIRESNIRNYSIYMSEIEGKLYLFAYFEYVGDDFEADMAKMAKDEATQLWWELTDPCQRRLPGTPPGEQWKSIPEVFHTD